MEAKVKENIVKKGLVDNGHLLNSVTHSVRMFPGGGEAVVNAGDGVRYAYVQEYGKVIRPVFTRKLAVPISDRAKKESAAGQGPGSYGRTENHPDRAYWNPQYYRVGSVLKDVDTDAVAWALLNSIEIKPKRYMRDSLAEITPHVLRILSQFGAELK